MRRMSARTGREPPLAEQPGVILADAIAALGRVADSGIGVQVAVGQDGTCVDDLLDRRMPWMA
jgi:hypothetical protein